MIKTVNGSGRYMMVNGGMPATTYIPSSSGYMNVGDLRYNTQIHRLEVYDGNMWIELNTGHASVGLTPEAESLLDWAKQKRIEEDMNKSLAESNPTIADLIEQKKKIDEQISIVKTLIKSETTN